MDSRYGLLLLSFTATFVGFMASRFWRLTTLILHRIYSTTQPRDALHHQRQVVLRNSVSAASTLRISLQLAWCWRALANGYLARTLLIIMSAASAFCAFTVAGGFTSSISSGIGNDVLVDGSRCGVIEYDSMLTIDTMSVIYPHISQSMSNAANYAQQCYSPNATGTLDCTTFVKSHLPFISVLNASCPFSDNICRSNDSNLLLDSGLINSDDLGLNMPNNQRMFYREMLHCAPLRTDGFIRNLSANHQNYTRYFYGRRFASDGFRSDNWTYEVEDLNTQYRRGSDNNLVPISEFVAIPQLTVSEADLLVVFLSPDGIVFMNKTDDIWYRGTIPRFRYSSRVGQRVMYMPGEAASPMGCVKRFQYCNSSKKCGSLASHQDAVTSAMPLFHESPSEYWSGYHSSDQEAMQSRFDRFISAKSSSQDLYSVINCLGQSSLLSYQHLNHGMMGPLPDNQWQLDATHWFAMRMASIQAAYVNTARGPTDDVLLPYLTTTDDRNQITMCNNQASNSSKIRSTGYTSLSLFGLYFTYLTGIIIILASYTAEPVLTFFYFRRKYEDYKYLEWAANGTLQLQRLAYQGVGSEKWSNYTDDIPKTRPGYFLADLARAYPPDDEEEVQGMKPTVHTTSTTTPSVSETSANLRVSQQSQGAPSRPTSAVSELAPQAVSPQAVSPISQHPQG
ncbi:hypothetical protein LA080_013133 [Diaporthe eres]|nr:hypothetical protein LA080_013133 [Diaporthe eres]